MRVNKPTQPKKHSPGWFHCNHRQFMALSHVPRALDMSASDITDAVSRGDLEIVRISGCKAVAFEELLRFIDLMEDRK